MPPLFVRGKQTAGNTGRIIERSITSIIEFQGDLRNMNEVYSFKGRKF
jgi:hypothetical protein